ncbi:MAG: ATP-dependent zinc metalloprotease FtsH [Simkaniaceae bacterium]|nr:ATP-dependent zinc metalloprotease FtsH [Simkaniaceae bacterium]
MAFNNDNNQPKRGLPGGFFLFLLASILVILTVQNLASDRAAKVAFSHQAEHLVNLDLINQGQSHKVALNDHLVTFSGKFKAQLTEEAKQRYRYLELLNEEHNLKEGQVNLAQELSSLEKEVRQSAETFLLLSGMPIPHTGYIVISSSYDIGNRVNGVVIQELAERPLVNLREVTLQYSRQTEKETLALKENLIALIQGFRSNELGIGNEVMKKKLTDMLHSVEGVSGTFQEEMAVFASSIEGLQSIVKELNGEKNGIRLFQLRSVRNYLVDLEQYSYLSEEVEKNTARLDKARQNVANVVWFYNNKELSTRALEKQDADEFNRWFSGAKSEWENFGSNQGLLFKAPDQPRNTVLEKTFKSREPAPNYLSYLFTLLPVILILLVLYYIFSRQMKGLGGSGAMNFGKSPAKLLSQNTEPVTFKDVAGVDEAREELEEIVDFLKNPIKYTTLGARIPKGVLCVGPPGTGKTLIARAVAGEAEKPFFSISGSDFVEMFVGVGASRIRDLFDQAKKNAPCIVFIDEIDAVGRHRGAGVGGGHDEREQTLNQLLVEMDGFEANEGVILMAATNRPDVLDKALLRPGRFDRRIILDLPDIKGRYEILKVHARRVKLDETVDLMMIARNTPGSSGADLMNILNESALLAARKERGAVTMPDVLEATEKVKYGKERRSLEIDAKEKEHTAYHESGHAVVGLIVSKGDPVEKVTIIPRGMSLGATHFVPEKNKLGYWKGECLDRLATLMGGRIAEEIFIGDYSSGAQMDIAQATRLARSMVCEWGMADSLGSVTYDERSLEGSYLMPGQSERNYSEETARVIDGEVKKLLDAANTRAREILHEKKDLVEQMTRMLLEFEMLDREDLLDMLEGRWEPDKKRAKVKFIEESHRKLPPPPQKEVPLGDMNPQVV